MKKNLYLPVSVIACIILITSCTKTVNTTTTINNPPATPTILGLWIGDFDNNGPGSGKYPSNQFVVLFKAHDSVRVFDAYDTAASTLGGGTGNGTYSLVQDTVQFRFIIPGPDTLSAIAVVNTDRSYMLGSLGIGGTDSSNLGSIFLTK